jgi:alanine dehydrogenase
MGTSSISVSVSKPSRLRHTLILTQPEIERLVEMRTAIRVITQAFKAQAKGHVVMPPKIYLPLPQQSDFRAMPAYLSSPACCGIKWVNVHPNNSFKGLPTVMGTLIINDPKTGFPLAVMDGLSVTRLRTGASAGVAAKTLVRPQAQTVGLVGCGAQAFAQVRALAELFRLRTVRVWGYRPGEARRFCEMVSRHVGLSLIPVPTVKACVVEADIIVTVTPSRRPLVRREWVKPGTHINAVGADAPGKQELDPQILRDAKVVVDDRTQAIHGGELNVPIAKGLFSPRHIHATLGEVLLGRVSGRVSPEELTVFDSTGIAVHDVALGYEIFRLAIRAHRGRAVRFFHWS